MFQLCAQNTPIIISLSHPGVYMHVYCILPMCVFAPTISVCRAVGSLPSDPSYSSGDHLVQSALMSEEIWHMDTLISLVTKKITKVHNCKCGKTREANPRPVVLQ